MAKIHYEALIRVAIDADEAEMGEHRARITCEECDKEICEAIFEKFEDSVHIEMEIEDSNLIYDL